MRLNSCYLLDIKSSQNIEDFLMKGRIVQLLVENGGDFFTMLKFRGFLKV